MKLTITIAAGLIAIASTAQAVVLQPIATGLGDNVFKVEAKYNENVHNNRQRGRDVFLRNGNNRGRTARQFDYGASGTSYDWSLAYDGDIATFTFGGDVLTRNIITDGIWNGFEVYARADDKARFTTATTTVSIDSVNGAKLTSAAVITATDGLSEAAFALGRTLDFTEIGGTLQFDFVLEPGAKGTPNRRLAFGITGVEVPQVHLQDGPGAAAVPVPTGLVLMASGIAVTGMWLGTKRRRKH